MWVVIEMMGAQWRRRLAAAVRRLLVDPAAKAGTALGRLRTPPRRVGTLAAMLCLAVCVLAVSGPLPAASAATPPLPAGLGGQNWTAIPTHAKVVALTFDAGANADGVQSILGTLAKYHATATFMLTGNFVQDFPAQAKAIAAAGYRIGNHSVSHPYFTTLTDAQIRDQVLGAESRITSVTGADPWPWFRFPYGDYNQHAISVVNGTGFVPVGWTVDTLGWEGTSGGITTQTVRSRVLGSLQPGEIVLMHCGSNPDDHSTLDADALPAVIQSLQARGYSFVTLDALGGQAAWSSRQASQAAAQASGVIDVFWKAANTSVGHNWYVAGWNGPQQMGANPVAGEPSATTSSPGVVDVFWRGSDGHLWHQWYTPSGGWSGQQQMPAGTIGGPPQAVAQADGGVDVFWRGTDNHLWQMSYRPGQGWSGARNLGGSLACDPAPAATTPGTADVFWQGTDGQLWHVYRIGTGSWSAAASVGIGLIAGPPSATGQATGAVDVFWKGADGHLWRAGYTPGSGWSGAADLGGALASNPAPVASAPGTVDVFFTTTNGNLWHIYRVGGGSWSPASSLGMGTLGSKPWATAQPAGAIDVFWRGSGDSHLWHASYRPGTGWAGPGNLGGDLYPVS